MLPSDPSPAEELSLPTRNSLPHDFRPPTSLPANAEENALESSSTTEHGTDDHPEGSDTNEPVPSGFYGNTELPEDDGMTKLRRRILDVQSREVAPPEKAKLMHGILMEGYTRARQAHQPVQPIMPISPAVEATIEEPSAHFGPLESLKFWHGSHSSVPPHAPQKFTLTEADLRPTYAPQSGNAGVESTGGEEEARRLGCAHYRRNIKLQCVTCGRWYTCRLCHDEAEDHMLPRRDTKYMLCMLCGYAQHAGDICHKCGKSAARYYCNICKLWDDAPDKSIYHCNDCGLCRVGEGLGKDYFHCKKCGSCIAINQGDSHRCREGVMDCDCPICGEYMFTSYKKVVTMKCGHTIHDDCRAEYIKRSFKCPICNKSIENMESMFRRLDKHLEEQPMPPEYADTRAIILCNDCEAKTTTKYHWGGLRCEVCMSYNTVELHLLNSPKSHQEQERQREQAAAATEVAGGSERESEEPDHSTQSGLAVPIPVPRQGMQSLSLPLPSPPLSSSPNVDSTAGRSTPLRLFRSVSPAHMQTPTTAPVMAEPPPGYGRDGLLVEDDEDFTSDVEDHDILGLWRPHRHSFLAGHDSTSPEENNADEEEDSDDSADPQDDDYDDDDDDEEEEISLFGHR